jgi:hypothetical protein
MNNKPKITTHVLGWNEKLVLHNETPNRTVVRLKKKTDGSLALHISIYDPGEGDPEEDSSNRYTTHFCHKNESRSPSTVLI